MSVELHSDQAGILTLATAKKTPAGPGDGLVLTSLVAGAGFVLCDIFSAVGLIPPRYRDLAMA